MSVSRKKLLKYSANTGTTETVFAEQAYTLTLLTEVRMGFMQMYRSTLDCKGDDVTFVLERLLTAM